MTGLIPFQVMVFAHSKVVSIVFNRVALQWLSRIPQQRSIGYICYSKWILSQYDFKVIFVRKVDHALHELCSMTGVLWTVVQVDDQLLDMTILFFVIIPPVLKAVDNKITGFE